MTTIASICWKVLKVGGWAPLLVFSTHMFIDRVLNAYKWWPPVDIPMHISGGLAIAFCISRCFQTLPRQAAPNGRCAILELLLTGSLTATATILWEFAEFSLDQLKGTNIQISLANTMQDLAMGILGAIIVISIRAAQLRAGTNDLKELVLDWIQGQGA
ncbi:MAG: hypothetical protein WCS01_14045 [bacterium]